MSAVYATGRLLWRPAALMLLFPMVLVSVLSTFDLPNGPADVVDAFRSGTQVPVVTLVFWRFATLVPAMIGLMLSGIMRELQHTAFGWTLPDLSRRLEIGKIVIGIVIAASIGFSATLWAGAQLGFPLFGWCLLSFGLGGVVFDPAMPKLFSRSTLVLVAAIALRPHYIRDLAQAAPELLSVLASVASVVLIHREFSRNVSRQRALVPTTSGLTYSRRFTQHYWQRHTPNEVSWSTSLATPNILSWVRAGHLETFGRRRYGFLMGLLVPVLLAVTLVYFTGGRQMVVFFPWIFLGMSGAQIHSRFLYPISRQQRAKIFFASTLFESLAAAAAGIAGLALISLVGHWPGVEPEHLGSMSLASIFIFFSAWAPVNHWAKIKGPLGEAGSSNQQFRYFGLLMLHLSLAMASAIAFRELVPSPAATWISGAALMVVVHAVYWFALRHHFRTRDLVVARA